MPRIGTGEYRTPAGTDGSPGATISSSAYNINVHDVEADLNYPRPILSGGTGGSSADAALTNLGAEKSNQIVTNFDAHPWKSGSFSAEPGASGPPGGLTTHRWAGFVVVKDVQNIVVEARDLTDVPTDADPGTLWVRRMVSNRWSSWYKTQEPAATIDEMRAGIEDTKRATPYNHKYSHTPAFKATAGSQSAAGSPWKAVVGFSEQFDSDGCFNGISFQPLVEGWYQCCGVINMPTSGGTIGAALTVNDTILNEYLVEQATGVTATIQLQVTGMIELHGSDSLELWGLCDHPAQTFNSAAFWAFRIGPNF